ncbi:MAG TPA: biotin/lipoate A/B protein ligase family protein [bacterium]|nr:biotin/lipoate A/B protein ligase family protein [bacterium]HOL49228.1 biotin/lipoate A/B protein ligase family protein [bacterium]HPO52324.1 biotin/lipoate A/B protein ligase family protein [bacterium]HXK44481.1 biotin/lipoate A/B protein ligase family protein [bacterium]
MNRKWLYVITQDVSPQMNMALDSIMWNKVKQYPDTAILRFYTWKPSGVSLGAHQKPENLVNVSFCKQNNIPVVARITGGSAIFHDREITYSFSATNDEKVFSGPITSYEKICGALKTGLEKLGIRVQWRGVSKGKEPSFTDRDCFSLSTRHDLVVDDRKIIGSAQRKDRTSFLQHGSLLIEIQKHLWEKIFLAKPDFSKIISMSEILSNVPDFDTLIKVLKNGFEQFFESDFEEIHFTSEDIKEAEKIQQTFLLV